MPELTLYHVTFLRHGESVGNVENRFQGQMDYPLTGRGRDQAQALASCWKEEGRIFDLCIASPLLRARQTAEILSAELHFPVELDPDWMEIENGVLKGLTHAEGELVAPRPAFRTPYTRYGLTGESRWEVYLRAGRAIQHILDRPPARYLVIAHGGILNMALYAILNIPVQAGSAGPHFIFGNTFYAAFNYELENHCWQMLEFGSNQHWKE